MKRIISILLVVCVMLSIAVFSTNAASINYTKVYEEEFKQFMIGYGFDIKEDYEYIYFECYSHYSDENNTDIPDWVLAFGAHYGMGPLYSYGIFDDCYYIQEVNCYQPFTLGYVIYVPAEDRFYALEDAWEKKIEGIDKAFTEGLIPLGVAGVIGDADKDGGLSILDATQIQLEVASLAERKDVGIGGLLAYGEEMKYITDLDRDGVITVMDATEIQRKLARIE